VQVENTHNRAGGVVVPQAQVQRMCAAARELGLACFLDGARLWNASIASGVALEVLAAPFDLVAVAFQQGPGRTGRLAAGRPTRADRRGRSPSPAHGRRNAAERHLQPPPRCTRWTTTWRGWPTTTPTPAPSPSGWPPRSAGAARPAQRADQHRGVPPAGVGTAGCVGTGGARARAKACWSTPSVCARCAP
jgi:hypothetical protein